MGMDNSFVTAGSGGKGIGEINGDGNKENINNEKLQMHQEF